MRLQTTIEEVLSKAEEMPWDHHLYVPIDTSLVVSTPVIVLNDDEEMERTDNDEPLFTESRKMKYLLGISDVQSVVENLLTQSGSANTEQLLEALQYYVKNDAFITK